MEKEDERCCGTGHCMINAQGSCWCGQQWDGEKMCHTKPAEKTEVKTDVKAEAEAEAKAETKSEAQITSAYIASDNTPA